MRGDDVPLLEHSLWPLHPFYAGFALGVIVYCGSFVGTFYVADTYYPEQMMGYWIGVLAMYIPLLVYVYSDQIEVIMLRLPFIAYDDVDGEA